MSYICTKKLTIGEIRYHPGEIIPDDSFIAGGASKLKKYGYLEELPDAPGSASASTENSGPAACLRVFLDDVVYHISEEQLQDVVNLMRKNAQDAAAAIEDEIDETVLTIIAKTDSRKTVAQAAEKQLAVISSVKGAGGLGN